jgi:hypothetical protein
VCVCVCVCVCMCVWDIGNWRHSLVARQGLYHRAASPALHIGFLRYFFSKYLICHILVCFIFIYLFLWCWVFINLGTLCATQILSWTYTHGPLITSKPTNPIPYSQEISLPFLKPFRWDWMYSRWYGHRLLITSKCVTHLGSENSEFTCRGMMPYWAV